MVWFVPVVIMGFLEDTVALRMRFDTNFIETCRQDLVSELRGYAAVGLAIFAAYCLLTNLQQTHLELSWVGSSLPHPQNVFQ